MLQETSASLNEVARAVEEVAKGVNEQAIILLKGRNIRTIEGSYFHS